MSNSPWGNLPPWTPIVWEPDGRSSAKKKHQYKATLLLSSTVYDCEYCGIKKEHATSDYCEGEDDDDWGCTGGW
jgi:hypothetical protein